MEAVNPPVLPPLTIATTIPDGDIIVPPTPTNQLLPLSETDGLTSGAVQPPGSTGENLTHSHHYEKRVARDGDDSDSSFTDEGNLHEMITINDVEDEEQRLIRSGGTGIPIGPVSQLRICASSSLHAVVWLRMANRNLCYHLLHPSMLAVNVSCWTWTRRSCTVASRCVLFGPLPRLFLAHPTSLQAVPSPDYIVPVEIESYWHNFYVLKRPGVDDFLRRMGEIYEVVVFTASLSKVRLVESQGRWISIITIMFHSMPTPSWTGLILIIL